MSSMMNSSYGLGDHEESLQWAKKISDEEPDSDNATLASALSSLVSTAVDSDLTSAIERYGGLAGRFESKGYGHYQGISLLNQAWLMRARGDADLARTAATRALEALACSSAGTEMSTAHAVCAWACAHLGDWPAAEQRLAESSTTTVPGTRFESLVEGAEIVGAYDDLGRAAKMLEEAELLGAPNSALCLFQMRVIAEQQSRMGRPSEAIKILASIDGDRATCYPGFHVQRLLALLNARLLESGELDDSAWRALGTLARRQGAKSALLEASLLRGLAGAAAGASAAVEAIGRTDRALLSIRAEAVLRRFADLSDAATAVVHAEAVTRPRRWRTRVRELVLSSESRERLQAALLLELIGTREDVRALRIVAREIGESVQKPEIGKMLAMRTADAVYVEDLGRVVLRIGEREIPGTTIRRKALALLCFLIAQPRMSATRDQVLDALWPDLDPSQAANSLHQTVYFLRRVFEPGYVEDLSPGYVHHDSDVLWLNQDLVTSRSREFRNAADLVASLATPEQAERVSELYGGRFALDFAYEEWAEPVRESMHARYLEIIERVVSHDADTGHIDRALRLAQRALEIDPQLDEIAKSSSACTALLEPTPLPRSSTAATHSISENSGLTRLDLETLRGG